MGNPARTETKAEELRASRDAHHGFPISNSPYSLCGRKATVNEESAELRSCVEVVVTILSSLSLTVLMASVDLKQH